MQITAEAAFTAHLALIAKDIGAWVALFAEDAVIEFPYASAVGSPQRLEGKTAILDYMKSIETQMQDLVFTNIRTYPDLPLEN